ncbi:hypothetical protein RM844_07305 [Streptomyces sp. DSM 44915]|uniref:Uncharacterized protein n=1 Tax=Streptomyces chisholmiae TaxID=3075540 RepID=A0ABU2JM94_9ACTN|nr:hypothetical protein [Streptomyces sp. DSM 44915]MDT0266101.1 hypothetical protein [Streptomyces sp. DSM 44915]
MTTADGAAASPGRAADDGAVSERVTAAVAADPGGPAVDLVGPPSAVAEFRALAEPFVEVRTPWDGGPPRPTVHVVTDAPRGDGWRRVAYASAYEPDRVVWLDDARRGVAVVGEPSAWRAQQVLRSVRHLLRWQAYARGDLLLHGGMVALDGRGLVVIGGKKSGKTSTLLSALVHAGADFVSNDDVTLTEGPGGRLVGYGFPRTVNIRTDVLLALAGSSPRIGDLLAEAGHPTNGFAGRHRTAEALRTESGAELPGSLWVRATELARATGCRLLPRFPVGAVVLPGFDAAVDGPRLGGLAPGDAGPRLAEHVEREGTKYDPFLRAWFPVTDEARRARLTGLLTAAVPFGELRQSMVALPEATRLVGGWLAGRGR